MVSPCGVNVVFVFTSRFKARFGWLWLSTTELANPISHFPRVVRFWNVAVDTVSRCGSLPAPLGAAPHVAMAPSSGGASAWYTTAVLPASRGTIGVSVANVGASVRFSV